ncbi:MAG: hypothetical protein OXC30_01035 [Alphaproteobacteria bacterium]|nr:hypothetical protein [Alphaproteobacteria bacterium]
MQNIMRVFVFIMLQIQIVHASDRDLECVRNNLSHFVRGHSQFCYSNEYLMGELSYAECNSCLSRRVSATILAEIAALMDQRPRVREFLNFRKSLKPRLRDIRVKMGEDYEERDKLFAAWSFLADRNFGPSDRQVVLKPTIFSGCVKDALDNVIAIAIANNNVWNDEQQQSIDELIQNDSWTQVVCVPNKATADIFKKNLQSYSQAITRSQNLMQQYHGELVQLWEKEIDYAQESRLVQNILDQEIHKRVGTIFRNASLCAVIATAFSGVVAWYLCGYL